MRKLLILLVAAGAMVWVTGGCGKKEATPEQKKEAESILPKNQDAQRPPPVAGTKPGTAAKKTTEGK